MTHYMSVDSSGELIDLDALAVLIESEKVKQQADSVKSKQAVIPKEPVKAVTPVFPDVNDLYSERLSQKPVCEADMEVDKTGIIDLYSERMKRIEKLKRR